jgi:hypothetical protein
MRDYSPKRRTALVLTGSGASGAYHAGVMRALDESGVKVDLVVGSGVGNVAAAFAAIAGGGKLYGAGGFWDGAGWSSLYRLQPALRIALLLLATAFGVFLFPVGLALLAGLLFPLVLIVDVVAPGLPSRLIEGLWAAPAVLRAPYLAALAVPVFALSVLAVVYLLFGWLKSGRRLAEAFETPLDARPARKRLSEALWEVARGSAISADPPSEPELGRRFVSLLAENLGQPGFRELILRVADLETGDVLPFVLLHDGARAAFASTRARGPRSRLEGIPGAVDLREPGHDSLLFDAVITGLLPPLVAPVRRVSFPKGGIFAGETHRLTDATLAAGCGISEAIAAGAEQVIVASGSPHSASPPPRRRGPRAAADGMLATLERQALEEDVRGAERTSRIVETLGHRMDDGSRAWQDPATGRVYRDVPVYVIRPDRRAFGPLELDGARDPATEVLETPEDLVEQGYRDAYRMFVEPVVGAVPEPRRRGAREEGIETQPVEL